MSFLTFPFNNYKKNIFKKIQDIIININELESKIKKLTDIELKKKTFFFKQIILNGCKIDKILPEVYAVCREASFRVLKMRHFDVQMIGGVALHYGKIVEMQTGEGKTLMSTLPAYLNALSGNGVHIITVNDYLANRDAKWMGILYNWLGINVGTNLQNLDFELKKKSYMFDITYGTNNEFTFDYLKDNIIFSVKNKIQRNLNFVIIDEVDSILIDEARIPLIISSTLESDINLCIKVNQIPKQLKMCTNVFKKKIFFNFEKSKIDGDYVKDEKNFQVWLTEFGYLKIEKILVKMGLIEKFSSLYSLKNVIIVHYIYIALQAHVLYKKNKHYIVQDGSIVIIDEFTGRLTPLRRWGRGLHQALEAKEGLKIQNDNQIIASITYQNYFKMYRKISGMTGTASSEISEFKKIYNLDTIIIPTNKPNIRIDYQDQIFITKKYKYIAIVKDIFYCYKIKRPVLVGTTSVQNSELISKILIYLRIPHNILNAKYYENEAFIIAQAGKLKMITIATNMAGRGTDIILGGNYLEEIKLIKNNDNLNILEKKKCLKKNYKNWRFFNKYIISLGGLHIIGGERNEFRRIDYQLRGRTARQGDPGSSCFYLSLEDSLILIFCGNYIKNIVNKLDINNNFFIESNILTKSIELAQKRIEVLNFNIRKNLLDYDNIINIQRKIVYKERNIFLFTKDISKVIYFLIKDFLIKIFRVYVPVNTNFCKWNLLSLDFFLNVELKINFSLQNFLKDNFNINDKKILKKFLFILNVIYKEKILNLTLDIFNILSRSMILRSIDFFWRKHLLALELLKEGIYLRSYIQKNPKQEFNIESFKLFNVMLKLIKEEITKIIFRLSKKNFVSFDLDKQEFLNDMNYIYFHNKFFKNSIYYMYNKEDV